MLGTTATCGAKMSSCMHVGWDAIKKIRCKRNNNNDNDDALAEFNLLHMQCLWYSKLAFTSWLSLRTSMISFWDRSIAVVTSVPDSRRWNPEIHSIPFQIICPRRYHSCTGRCSFDLSHKASTTKIAYYSDTSTMHDENRRALCNDNADGITLLGDIVEIIKIFSWLIKILVCTI